MGFLVRKSENTNTNPATIFFEWKSNDKTLGYYDKEEKTNKLIDLPLRFLVLEEYHTVKGWSDSDQCGIYANEVLRFNSEITVKTFKGREIASGIYKKIKSTFTAAGGQYVKSIYIMLESGEIVNIQIKGASVKAWSDFIEKNWNRLREEFVLIDGFTEEKKGSVKYTVPTFKFDKTLSDSEYQLAVKAAEKLETYMDEYMGSTEATPAVEPATNEDAEDLEKMPF